MNRGQNSFQAGYSGIIYIYGILTIAHILAWVFDFGDLSDTPCLLSRLERSAPLDSRQDIELPKHRLSALLLHH